MATNIATSPKYGHISGPATPIHSPQHSIHSSTSSRHPLQNLTLHEYRRLQNTPPPPTATPPGKTLRRKAAASTLNGLERVPSVSGTSASSPRFSSRPLHLSQSAHQLTGHESLPPSPPHVLEEAEFANRSFRSQSAAPQDSHSSYFGLSAYADSLRSFTPKVSNWKPIKKLPKPLSAIAPLSPIPPPAAALVPPLQTATQPTPTSSSEGLPSTNAFSTPTPSLSRFPQPPHLAEPPLSPPSDENALPRLNVSFTSTALATPPATPAVIHYRGTSFDLVNPRDSLLFHDIVTPSRGIDSSEYLPLRSSESALGIVEMAPRRPLYGDLSSAYHSIARRDDPNLDAPLPPLPVAISPESSQYSSPDGTPYDDRFVPSPLAPKRTAAESRFSLRQLTPIKQLTRTFTQKLSKSIEPAQQELQEFRAPYASPTTSNFESQYPRGLNGSYPTTPVESQHPTFANEQEEDQRTSMLSVEQPRFSEQPLHSAPLSSMIPDDPLFQVGRAVGPRISLSAGDTESKAYYEESIYPSSSIYEGDVLEGNRGYPPSLYSNNRKSNPFQPLKYDTDELTTAYPSGSMYSFANINRSSRRVSQSFLRSEKTDTISKFIDQYEEEGDDETPEISKLDESENRPQVTRGTSGLSQFDFGLDQKSRASPSEASLVPRVQLGRAGRPTFARGPGSPPPSIAPLAPALEYDEEFNVVHHPIASDMFSGGSSYEDTRYLLQLSQPSTMAFAVEASQPRTGLEPSSSYSQPEAGSGGRTPQEALDQAEQIFDEARGDQADVSIPAMWARRCSGDLLRNRQSSLIEDGPDDRGDWETIGNNSRRDHLSMDDSIANYSSTDGSRVSFGPVEEDPLAQSPQRGATTYRHPSPLPDHAHPFSSSPPALSTRASIRTEPLANRDMSQSFKPPYSQTVPVFESRTRGHNDEPYFFMPDLYPWATHVTPYALSDKETQEMLNSGPNEEILYEDMDAVRLSGQLQQNSDDHYKTPHGSHPPERALSGDLEAHRSHKYSAHQSPSTVSPFHDNYSTPLKRESTFEKLTILGPKRNITGTPRGTNMHETGSSVADNSSPGATWSSSPASHQHPQGFADFYTQPGSTSSRTVIRKSRHAPSPISPTPHQTEHDRSPSQETLFPSHSRLKSIPVNPSPLSTRPRSVRSIASSRRSLTNGRPAVAGQTKLREMMLLSDAHTTSSSQSAQFHGRTSGRPSTSDTTSPLRPPMGQQSVDLVKRPLANEHSPHLLCVERQLDPEEEAARRKLSWILFACFFVFPPAIILFRFIGDFTINQVSRGRFGHCAKEPKQAAVPAAILTHFTILVVIVVPIVVKALT